jgi:hypothetical protein
MNNTKPHNDYESKNSNWLLQQENKWVYAHYNSIKHKKNCGFIPQSSGGQDAFANIRFAIRGMLVGYIILLIAYISPYPLTVYTVWLIYFFEHWKEIHEDKMMSGYPYLEPSPFTLLPVIIAIPILFIGYLIMDFLGGLVEGKLNTAIIQFSISLLILGIFSFRERRKKQKDNSLE